MPRENKQVENFTLCCFVSSSFSSFEEERTMLCASFSTAQSSEKSRCVCHIIHGNERTRRRKRKEFFWRRNSQKWCSSSNDNNKRTTTTIMATTMENSSSNNDTIVAIATPIVPQLGGVSIVRIRERTRGRLRMRFLNQPGKERGGVLNRTWSFTGRL